MTNGVLVTLVIFGLVVILDVFCTLKAAKRE